MSKLTPFGMFLHMRHLNRLHEYPVANRQSIIDRLNELISGFEYRLANPPKKGGLPDAHYEREKKMYKEELMLAKRAWQIAD